MSLVGNGFAEDMKNAAKLQPDSSAVQFAAAELGMS